MLHFVRWDKCSCWAKFLDTDLYSLLSYSCYSYVFKYFCVIMPMLPCWDCCTHTSVLFQYLQLWIPISGVRGNALLSFDMGLLCFEEMLSVPLHSSTLSSCVPSLKYQFCHVCLEWLFVWEKKLQMLTSHSFLATCFLGQGDPAGTWCKCWEGITSWECVLLLFPFLQTTQSMAMEPLICLYFLRCLRHP